MAFVSAMIDRYRLIKDGTGKINKVFVAITFTDDAYPGETGLYEAYIEGDVLTVLLTITDKIEQGAAFLDILKPKIKEAYLRWVGGLAVRPVNEDIDGAILMASWGMTEITDLG